MGPDICSGCFRDLPRVEASCPRCARPVAGGRICGRCLWRPPPWRAAVAPLRYVFPVDRMLQELKYEGRLMRARLLGELLGHWVRGRNPVVELLLPVPLHPRRWRQRGFNQARELALAAGRVLGVRMADDICSRVADTPPLWDLTPVARRRVLRGAFKVDADVRGRRVTLIDDVLTTGATAATLSRALLSAGAASVDVWAIARAGVPQTGPKT